MEAAVDDSVSIVYMCNPNNPTGMTIDGDVLRAFCRSVSKRAVVLVDEAYNELTDDPDAPDAARFWQNVKDGRYSIGEVPRERWDPDCYWDPDPKAPNKTYSKIGGFVREGGWEWDPMGWKLPIPPKVADAMDEAHQWSVACARAVLLDGGHFERPLDQERTAVVIGAMLIAPLITPLMGIAISVVMGWPNRLARSAAVAAVGVLLALYLEARGG